MKIAYCIHSLHLFGGIERVLSIKANYLADVYGYDIHIITADQKERPVHFHLSDRITLHDVGTSEKFMQRQDYAARCGYEREVHAAHLRKETEQNTV